MKKAICLIVVLFTLIVGSSVVLADPKGEPGSGTEPMLIYYQ
jgi:hypothetical protein